MKRLALIGALLGALFLGATSTSQAYYPYARPLARVTARAVLPPYGPRAMIAPRVYGPRAFYRPGYYGPRFYGPPYSRGFGPGLYGPRVGVGIY